MSLQRLRERICQKVAELPLDCNVELVRAQLKPLLQEAAVLQHEEEESACQDTTCISPLMVASDKGNVACLEYFAQQHKQSTTVLASSSPGSSNFRKAFLDVMIGKPLDRASEAMGGNSAMHHAATSGCVAALKLWHTMGDDDYSYQKLGSITNAHGDTPLQIAATAGHLAFIQSWYKVALEEEEEVVVDNNSTTIQRILEMKNDSGDTCLSLACCHGQLDVLQFLLQDINPTISHDEVIKCQQACQRIIDSVARCNVRDPSALTSIQNRKDEMCRGLELFRQAYAHQVEQTAQDLLSSETPIVEGVQQQQQQQSNNRKSKKKKKAKGARVPTTALSKDNAPSDDTMKIDKSSPPPTEKDTVRVTTLSNGKLAVSVPGQAPDYNDNTTTAALISSQLPLVLANANSKKPSVSDMFRQRLQHVAATTAPTCTDNSEIDAMMDALCLDVSMLLYTPHGMALNLSPSQLEAVQHILNKQLAAVQEAREIQNRKHQQQQQQQQQASNPD